MYIQLLPISEQQAVAGSLIGPSTAVSMIADQQIHTIDEHPTHIMVELVVIRASVCQSAMPPA